LQNLVSAWEIMSTSSSVRDLPYTHLYVCLWCQFQLAAVKLSVHYFPFKRLI
jgi:hypothetical protein